MFLTNIKNNLFLLKLFVITSRLYSQDIRGRVVSWKEKIEANFSFGSYDGSVKKWNRWGEIGIWRSI